MSQLPSPQLSQRADAVRRTTPAGGGGGRVAPRLIAPATRLCRQSQGGGHASPTVPFAKFNPPSGYASLCRKLGKSFGVLS